MAPLATDRPADGSLLCAEAAAVLLISNIVLESYLRNILAPKPIGSVHRCLSAVVLGTELSCFIFDHSCNSKMANLSIIFNVFSVLL